MYITGHSYDVHFETVFTQISIFSRVFIITFIVMCALGCYFLYPVSQNVGLARIKGTFLYKEKDSGSLKSTNNVSVDNFAWEKTRGFALNQTNHLSQASRAYEGDRSRTP